MSNEPWIMLSYHRTSKKDSAILQRLSLAKLRPQDHHQGSKRPLITSHWRYWQAVQPGVSNDTKTTYWSPLRILVNWPTFSRSNKWKERIKYILCFSYPHCKSQRSQSFSLQMHSNKQNRNRKGMLELQHCHIPTTNEITGLG